MWLDLIIMQMETPGGQGEIAHLPLWTDGEAGDILLCSKANSARGRTLEEAGTGLRWLEEKHVSLDLSLWSVPTHARRQQPYVRQRHPEAMLGGAGGCCITEQSQLALITCLHWLPSFGNIRRWKKKKRQKRGSCNPGEFFQADCQHSRFPRAFVSREKAPDKEMERTGRLFSLSLLK